MERKGSANGRRHADEEHRNGDLVKQSKTGLRPGDVTWIKLQGALWWPAQVVEEKGVSDSFKPRKGKSGEVLVRLYGTNEYSYIDPARRQTEFDNVLKKHNGNQKEILEKALEKELSEPRAARSKARSAKATGETKTGNGRAVKEKASPAKRATGEQDEVKKKIRPDSPSSDSGKSGGTARRLKVMQGLGLTPPSGSPFKKNGEILSIPQ